MAIGIDMSAEDVIQAVIDQLERENEEVVAATQYLRWDLGDWLKARERERFEAQLEAEAPYAAAMQSGRRRFLRW